MKPLHVDCPACGAEIPTTAAIVLDRAPIPCPACGAVLLLDPTALETAERDALRRTFRSVGRRGQHVRRYRVEVAPVADLPPGEGPVPHVAAAPALGRALYGVGDSPEAAMESLSRLVRLRGEAGRLPDPLPPSDADPAGRWIEASD